MFEEIARFLLAGAFWDFRADAPFVIDDDRLKGFFGRASAGHGQQLPD
tara:strand:+ start:272 stop:415 length:144 start_codon:yes stop_codon:yes gene_type:complete